MNKLKAKYLIFLNRFLDSKINLRRGERKKVFLLLGNIFLLISVLLILKPLFTSTLLSFHGVDIMPFAYVGIAATAIVVQLIVNRVSRGKELITLMVYNHISQITILVLIAFSLYLDYLSSWLSIVLYIYISIFALITVTYFYQYCQSLLTIREAKRIYAYIGSGAIAGGVFGGYFTSVMIPFVGNTGLVVAAIVFMLLSCLIIYILHTNYAEDHNNTLHSTDQLLNPNRDLSIINNRHVWNITMIIGLGVLVSKLIDYQFNSLAYDSILGEDRLTAFFGFWFSTINVIGLIIQMVLVTKIVDRLGVSRSIAILPIVLLVGSGLILVFPILALGIIMKLSEGSLKQSLYKTSTEINFMPLPDQLRNRAKTFVDVVVDSLATGLAGLIIFGIINQGHLPFYAISLITIGIIGCWLYFIYLSKNTYRIELAKMVKGDNLTYLETERVGSTVKKIALDNYILENKGSYKSRRELILDLTRHETANIRKSAILEYVKLYGHGAVEDLQHCIDDPSISVRKAVFFARVSDAKTEEELEVIFEGLNPENYVIATSALAESIGNNSKQKRIFKLNQKIEESYNLLSFSRNIEKREAYFGQIYRAIAISKYLKRYNLISDAIRNYSTRKLQEEALKAVAYGRSKRLFDIIRYNDIDDENHKVYFKMLAVFPKMLLSKLKKIEKDAPRGLIKYLPALEYVDSQKSIDYLFTLLDHPSLKVNRKALSTLNACRKKYSHLSFLKNANNRRLNREVRQLKKLAASITFYQDLRVGITDEYDYENTSSIIKKLQRRTNRSVLSIFIFMALITGKEELTMIYQAIKSARKDAALDLLDGILEYKLRKKLLPILELVVNRRYTNEDLRHVNMRPMTARSAKSFIYQLKDVELRVKIKSVIG